MVTVIELLWSSSTYSHVGGTCEFRIPDVSSVPFKQQITFDLILKYSKTSPIRKNETHKFKMTCIRSFDRIVAQTELSMDQQLMLTITMSKSNKRSIIGYYSMTKPSDSGIFTMHGDKLPWFAAFDLPL